MQEKRRKGRKTAGIWIGLLLSLCACSWQTGEEDRKEAAALERTEEGTGDAETEALRKAESLQREKGDGALVGEAARNLPEEAGALIGDYMDAYFRSVSDLQIVPELAELFGEPDGLQASMNEKGLEYLIGIRSMQNTDLRLADFYYELEILEVAEQEDGSLSVEAMEWNCQKFARHPEVDSEQYGIRHEFILELQGGKWKIREHLQRDGIYWHLLGEYWGQDPEEIPDPDRYFQERLGTLLDQYAEQIESREAADGEADGNGERMPECDRSYDRQQALSYAEEWIGRRNGEWVDYGGNGGNCQNYVSQCLLAGGIPMDREGERIWKWYGDTPDQGSGPSGRSASWTGVEEFREYAAQNEGFGLAAAVDSPYETGQPGDLIQMGFPDDWNHVVMIADVVRDESGETVDYLIHSNTSDMRDFPASAYPLPCRSLTRIFGWNERGK